MYSIKQCLAGAILIALGGAVLTTPQASAVEPPKEDDAREKALKLALKKLQVAEAQFAKDAAKAADKHLATIDEFIKSREGGNKPFAERVLSLKGKWVFVQGQFGKGDHDKFIQDEFGKHVFKPIELTEVIEKAISGYLKELSGMENELLVALRADLEESDPSISNYLPSTRSSTAFNDKFKQIVEETAKRISHETKYDVIREIASFVIGDLAGKAALSVMGVIAAKMGTSTDGIGYTVLAIGVGVVACILADLAIDEILKASGHDPVKACAEKVKESLSGIVKSIKEGDPQAHTDLKELLDLASSDPDEKVRAAALDGARKIATSGALGLQRTLSDINHTRALIRKYAITKQIMEDGK